MTSDQAIREEIRRNSSNLFELLTSQNLNAIHTFYAKDAIVLAPDRKDIVSGPQAIQKYWNETKLPAEHKYNEVEMRMLGPNHVLEIGIVRAKPYGGKYISIWQQENAGWKIMLDAWVEDAEPADHGGDTSIVGQWYERLQNYFRKA